MKTSPGSVTALIEHLRAGNHEAAQPLWERYYPRLVGLARERLRGTPRRAADEEDVALSAFDSFCRGVEQGRFPDLKDRDGLWALLVLITVRKAADLVQYNRRDRRGGGRVRGDSALAGPDGDTGADGLARIEAGDPTPPRGGGPAGRGTPGSSPSRRRCGGWAQVEALGRQLREAVAYHQVGKRPNRYEPRRRKLYPQLYPRLLEPRAQAQVRMPSTGCD